MLKYILFISFFIINQASAQVTLTGKSIDAISKLPLAGANVYINNTSIGTSTDSLGMFKLIVPTSGTIELVVSHVSYQKQIIVISTEKAKDLLIEMVAQQNVLNEVVINLKKKNRLKAKSWTELFSSNLIGNYEGVGSLCKITNANVLYFDYDESTMNLQVFAEGPILIENAALGYLIRLDLDQFSYDIKNNVMAFKYTVFFEDLVASESQMEQFKNKRSSLYVGSNMHFMRSMFSNTSTAEGFSIYKYTAVPNKERERVSAVIQQKKAQVYALQVNPGDEIVGLFPSRDTVNYYIDIMRQDKVLKYDTVKLAPNTITTSNLDRSVVNFNTNDTLMVTYMRLDSIKTNRRSFSSAVNVTKVAKAKRKRIDQDDLITWNSYLYFFSKDGINILSNGYYGEMGIFIYGDMAERRLAGLLPFDYDPKSL